jgi:7,8-dihydroneopterin aldolase/epimerase/oxygenase
MMNETMDTILINGLEVNCVLGMLDHERTNTQKVIFNVELYTSFAEVAKSNDIKDTLNYADVASLIERTSIDLKAEMVEFLAENLVKTIYEQYKDKLFGLKLEILKPEILSNTDSVGVRIVRMFRDH